MTLFIQLRNTSTAHVLKQREKSPHSTVAPRCELVHEEHREGMTEALIELDLWHHHSLLQDSAKGACPGNNGHDIPCVSQMLGGPSLRLGVTKECLNIPSGIG